MDASKIYCLWQDLDSGTIYMDLFSNMAERISFGGYVPSINGSKEVIEKLYKKLQKKPSLFEKHVKIYQS